MATRTAVSALVALAMSMGAILTSSAPAQAYQGPDICILCEEKTETSRTIEPYSTGSLVTVFYSDGSATATWVSNSQNGGGNGGQNGGGNGGQNGGQNGGGNGSGQNGGGNDGGGDTAKTP
ncbi:MAG: hypothetical protein IT198_14895 [Acidimicrobiia bacterium]|nr:hypothetical protein [Acidimicrobiia bacterium]